MVTVNKETEYDSQFVIQFLSKILIEEYILFLKTKNAFWNYEFNDSKIDETCFASQVIEIESLMQQIVKKIIVLNEFVELPYLEVEVFAKNYSKKQAAKQLIEANSLMIKTIKEWFKLIPINGYDDTKNLIQKLIYKHECIIDNLKFQIKNKP